MNIREIDINLIERADFNYKKEDADTYMYLRMSIQAFNQLKPLTVIQSGVETYECIEGRKILRVMRDMGKKTCFVNLLTREEIVKSQRINILLNSIHFLENYIELAKIVQKIASANTRQQLYSLLPFDKDTVDDFVEIQNFNWDLYKEEIKAQGSLFEEQVSEIKEEIKEEDVKLEDVKLEDVKLEDVKLEDVKLEDVKLEEKKSVEVRIAKPMFKPVSDGLIGAKIIVPVDTVVNTSPTVTPEPVMEAQKDDSPQEETLPVNLEPVAVLEKLDTVVEKIDVIQEQVSEAIEIIESKVVGGKEDSVISNTIDPAIEVKEEDNTVKTEQSQLNLFL